MRFPPCLLLATLVAGPTSVLSAIPLYAQTAHQSGTTVSSQAATNTYLVSGPLTDADLDRLLAALRKLNGVEQVEATRTPSGARLSVRGVGGTLLVTAAKSAGFELRPMPVRTYLASAASATADMARLTAALAKAPDVELVELGKSNGAPVLRIRGEATAPALEALAKTVGFEMLPVSSYVASGPTAEADLTRLRTALGSVAGIDKAEVRALPGGAAVVIHGDATDATLAKTARAVGYGLLPVSDAGGSHRFGITGVLSSAEEERLNTALHQLAGGGEFHLIRTPSGMQLDVIGNNDTPEQISAVASQVGVELHPLEIVTSLSVDANAERITPPAPGERTLVELAQPGQPAPDFTLIMKDGKSKVRLSDSFGKKPVVLIFGSYT